MAADHSFVRSGDGGIDGVLRDRIGDPGRDLAVEVAIDRTAYFAQCSTSADSRRRIGDIRDVGVARAEIRK